MFGIGVPGLVAVLLSCVLAVAVTVYVVVPVVVQEPAVSKDASGDDAYRDFMTRGLEDTRIRKW